jgi:hypothetical protein
VIVVNLGDVLAGGGSDHASGALDEQSVVGDRAGEEVGVERWGVEAFADEWCGADDEDAVAGFGVAEAVDRGSSVGGAHRAVE